MKTKNIILCILFILCAINTTKGEMYPYIPYTMPFPAVPMYPTIEVPLQPSATYSTYRVPRLRYEWVPIYTQRLVVPPTQYGFSWLRQPRYEPHVEWIIQPTIRP